jgi:hypothetical protein
MLRMALKGDRLMISDNFSDSAIGYAEYFWHKWVYKDELTIRIAANLILVVKHSALPDFAAESISLYSSRSLQQKEILRAVCCMDDLHARNA